MSIMVLVVYLISNVHKGPSSVLREKVCSLNGVCSLNDVDR
jgi:hypothetical protein